MDNNPSYKQEIEDITNGKKTILYSLSNNQKIVNLLFYNWDDVERADLIVDLLTYFKMPIGHNNRLLYIEDKLMNIETDPISISELQYRIENVVRKCKSVCVHCISDLKMDMVKQWATNLNDFKEVK